MIYVIDYFAKMSRSQEKGGSSSHVSDLQKINTALLFSPIFHNSTQSDNNRIMKGRDKMKSIWSEEYVNIPLKPRLNQDIHTDVLVIGGGMAGVLCAYYLRQKGVRCVLVEGKRIGSGNTVLTTAKITAQHGLIYDKLIRNFGKEKAGQYYRINTNAVQEFQRLSKKISCDYEEKTAYVCGKENSKKLEREAEAYDKLGISHVWKEKGPIPAYHFGALGIRKQAVLHPMKLIKGLLPELEYYEETFVNKIEENKAITDCNTITAGHIILATHYPMVNVPGGYFLKLNQQRSYVLALSGAEQLKGIYIGEEKNAYSFRNYRDLLLVGGGGHKTGKQGGAYGQLREMARAVWPDAKERYAWAAQDCISLDDLPYIGRHRRKKGYTYLLSGFNKWGMTGSMCGAMVLSSMIAEGRSDYQELFLPSRQILRPRLFSNLGSAALSLLMPGKRCAHLGCRLKWNKYEKSWDCPCHGSRFDEKGNVIDNPAKRGI